jgi:hypothetical protein
MAYTKTSKIKIKNFPKKMKKVTTAKEMYYNKIIKLLVCNDMTFIENLFDSYLKKINFKFFEKIR